MIHMFHSPVQLDTSYSSKQRSGLAHIRISTWWTNSHLPQGPNYTKSKMVLVWSGHHAIPQSLSSPPPWSTSNTSPPSPRYWVGSWPASCSWSLSLLILGLQSSVCLPPAPVLGLQLAVHLLYLRPGQKGLACGIALQP